MLAKCENFLLPLEFYQSLVLVFILIFRNFKLKYYLIEILFNVCI